MKLWVVKHDMEEIGSVRANTYDEAVKKVCEGIIEIQEVEV